MPAAAAEVAAAESGRLVTSFLEKPTPDETTSRKACPCFYALSLGALGRLRPYVAGAGLDLAQVDAPGNFLRHMVALNQAHNDPSFLPIEATQIQGRFDIGGLDTYVQCDEWFRRRENGEDAPSSASLATRA